MELCRRSKNIFQQISQVFLKKIATFWKADVMKVRKKLRFWGARGMDHVDGHAWCSLCPRHHTLNLPRKLRPEQGKTQENPQLGLVVLGHPHIAKSQQKGMNKIQKEKCKTLVFIKWIEIDVEINKRVQTRITNNICIQSKNYKFMASQTEVLQACHAPKHVCRWCTLAIVWDAK